MSLNLPDPHTDAWEWQLRARCRSYDVNLFYVTELDPDGTERAKSVCHDCPVRIACRDHAIAANEPHGIWGGLTPRERNRHKWLNYRPAPIDAGPPRRSDRR